MAEYIEQEAAKKIASQYGCANGSTLGSHSGIADCIAYKISKIPPADVTLVRHGKWIVFNDGTKENPEKGHMKCSVCGWYWSVPEHKKFFLMCPHCGARMD